MTAERAWARATRIALLVVGVLLLILVVSGVVLTFRYRPAVSSAYANVQSLKGAGTGGSTLMRNIHRWTARLFFPAVGFLGVASFGLFIIRRRWVALSLPLFSGFLTVIAFFTGLLLPWDQLALYAVTVGTNMEGYTPILHGSTVKSVIVGNVEVSPEALRAFFWTHLGATVAIIVVVLITTVLLRRASDPSEQAVGGEVGPEPERAELLPHD